MNTPLPGKATSGFKVAKMIWSISRLSMPAALMAMRAASAPISAPVITV